MMKTLRLWIAACGALIAAHTHVDAQSPLPGYPLLGPTQIQPTDLFKMNGTRFVYDTFITPPTLETYFFTNPVGGAFAASINTTAAMEGLSVAQANVTPYVRRLGFYTPGDGGDAYYYFKPLTCPSPDGGSQIAMSVGVGCWFLFNQGHYDPRIWGAYGDGKTLTTVATSTTASSPSVTIAGLQATTADVGKLITITDVIGGGSAAGPTYSGVIQATGLSGTPTDTVSVYPAPTFSTSHTQEIAWGHDDAPAVNAMTAYVASLTSANVGLVVPEINFGGGRYLASSAPFKFQANAVYRNGTLIAGGTAGLNCLTAPLVLSTANGNAYFDDLDISSNYLPVTGLGETTNAITFGDLGLRIENWAGTCGSVTVTASAPINSQVILVTSTAGLSTYMQAIGNSAIADRSMIMMVESSTTDPNSPCPGNICIVISKPTSAAITAASEIFYSVPHGFAEIGANSGAHLDGAVIREYGYADSDHGTGEYIVSSATVNSNGSGYPISQTGTLTWIGDSCSTNPVLNASTDASGNVSITSVATAGLCTLPPDPSVESWQAGGGLVGGAGTTVYLTFTSQGANGDKYGCGALIQGNQSDVWRSVITGGAVGLCVDNTGNGLNVVDGQIFNVGYNAAEYNAPAVLLAAGAKKVTIKGVSLSGVVQDYVAAHNPEFGVSLSRVNVAPANVTYGPLNSAVIHVGSGGTGWGASVTGTITWSGSGCPVDPVIQVTTDSTGAINSFYGSPVVTVPGYCTTMPSKTATTWAAVGGGGLSAGSGASVTMAANEFQVYAVTPAAVSMAAVHFDPYAVVNATSGLNYVSFLGLSPYGTSGFGTCGSTYSFSGLSCSQIQQIEGQISGVMIPAYTNGNPTIIPGVNLIGGQLLDAFDATAVLAANYTVQASADCPRDLNWNNGSTGYTVTLPATVGPGCHLTISANGSGAITLSPASGASLNNGTAGISANANALTTCVDVNNSGGSAADWFCDTLGSALLGSANTWTGPNTFSANLFANYLAVNGTTVPANGIYRPAANTLGFAANSTKEATLTTAALTVLPEIVVGTSSLSGAAASFQNTVDICTLTPAASTPTWSCSSDRALKKNIADAASALAGLMRFHIREFDMKSDGSHQTGVVAQELKETHPEMVHEFDQLVGAGGAERHVLAVESPNPWIVIKAVQELASWYGAALLILALWNAGITVGMVVLFRRNRAALSTF